MPKENENEKDKNKDSEMEFEFVEESEMELAKRGRKAKVNSEMVAKFQKAPKNKRFTVREFLPVEGMPSEKEKVNLAKAKINSEIRKHLKMAGVSEYAIQWTLDLIPTLIIKK